MLAFTASIVAYQGAAPAPRPVAAVQRTVQPTALELDGLKELASKQNPVLGYCTPRAAAASALCGRRRPARPVPKLTSLASGRGR